MTSALGQFASACATLAKHRIASSRLVAVWAGQACAVERYRQGLDDEGFSELVSALEAHARLYQATVAAIPNEHGDLPPALMWAHADVLAVSRSIPDLTVGWLAGLRRVVRADLVMCDMIREQARKATRLQTAAHLVAAVEESARDIDAQIEDLWRVLGN